jgi:hypothetical protein
MTGRWHLPLPGGWLLPGESALFSWWENSRDHGGTTAWFRFWGGGFVPTVGREVVTSAAPEFGVVFTERVPRIVPGSLEPFNWDPSHETERDLAEKRARLHQELDARIDAQASQFREQVAEQWPGYVASGRRWQEEPLQRAAETFFRRHHPYTPASSQALVEERVAPQNRPRPYKERPERTQVERELSTFIDLFRPAGLP